MNQIGVCGFIPHNLTFYPLSVLERGILFRIPQSMMDELKALENYPEFVRQAIQDALLKLKNDNTTQD
jgi:hypothetical protein